MKNIVMLVLILLSYSKLLASSPILIINSYGDDYLWTKKQNEGFRSVLNKDANISPSYSTEYLDTKRKRFTQDYEAKTVAYIKCKYENYSPKLIYVTDDNALHFILHNKDQLFPSVPIIFSGVNNLSIEQEFPNNNAVGVFDKKDITPNFELLTTLFPDDNELLILGDNSPTSIFIAMEIKKYMNKSPDLKVKYLLNNDFKYVLQELKKYKGKNIILTSIGAFKLDKESAMPLDESITKINKIGKFFILSLEDTYIKKGVIGGFCNNGFTHGEEAGKIALNILKKNKNRKSRIGKSSWIFDAQVLKNFEVDLPKEILTQVKFVNMEPTYYQTHETVITTLIYFLIFLVFIGALIFSFIINRNKNTIKDREKKLSVLSNRLSKAQEITHLGNWEWDIKTNTIWWSDEIYRIFGLEVQQFTPTYEDFIKYIYPDDIQLVEDAVGKSLSSDIDYQIVHRVVKPDGTLRYVREEGNLERDSQGNPSKMVGTVQDITEEVLINQELEYIATTDKLTGVYNRRKLEELFVYEEKRFKRYSSPISILFLDIDYFKSVNDTYGHDVGDDVLVELVKVLKDNIRQIDILARWGGEEFLILSPETNIDNAKIIAKKLRLAVENNSFNIVGKITISIGVSSFKINEKFSDLIKRADIALYEAKVNGRNQVVLK